MKRTTMIICALFLGTSLCRSFAQGDQQAAQKAWMDYMTPSSIHQMLAKGDGEWTADITLWAAPGAPPMKSTGTAVNRMILGGRYQESTNKGNFMGMPFEGVGIVGYDNAKKLFQSSWVDNMGTGIMYMEGKWDDQAKALTFTGKTVDPMTGKDVTVRETVKIIDDNNHVVEMFATADGKEFKTMEMKLTRK